MFSLSLLLLILFILFIVTPSVETPPATTSKRPLRASKVGTQLDMVLSSQRVLAVVFVEISNVLVFDMVQL